jgi:hypothetical protein
MPDPGLVSDSTTSGRPFERNGDDHHIGVRRAPAASGGISMVPRRRRTREIYDVEADSSTATLAALI